MKKLHQALILIAVYVLALGIRVYWLSQKNGLHVDEGLTIAIACYNDFIVRKNYEYGKKYTGKELKEASLVSSAGLKDALADVRDLWKDNRDPPHTNLYYTFLRLSLAGIKTGDTAPIVFRGGILNLLFFTVSFMFFFLLMRLFFAESILLQCASTFCAFLSTAAISNTLFLRPYQIQEMLFIMFCYYFVLSIGWKKYIIHESKLFIGVKPIALMSLITAFTLMSGYYALIFIGLFGLYAVYLFCKNKTFTEIPYYFVVLCLGILFARIFYPKYISGFFSYRGQETIKTISGNIPENILSSITSAGIFLQKYFFSYPVIAVGVLCLAYIAAQLFRQQKLIGLVQKLRGKKMPSVQKMALFIFAASVLYLFIVLIIAPYKVLRYGMPVFPFFVILPAMLINSIGAHSRKMAAGAMLLLCGCFAFNAVRESKIENIFRNKQNEYVFTQNKDTPVYVINGSWSSWKYANLIPYVHDEQAYYFIDWYERLGEYLRTGQKIESIHLPETENYNAIYLLIEHIPEFPQLNDLIMDNLQDVQGTIESEFEIYTGEPESWYPYFKGKKIILDGR
ncbi:MAG: hypothetical protein LBB72_04890 [Spirochaetaceae bacterium]|jgi:hypothetical protein|nr:hypothetical protein [Spirochaetaceae bacterium]